MTQQQPAASAAGTAQPRTFRTEIQFLRALAVAAVVVYHLNPAWLPGGYVGVDVFFVISGYLITSGILRQIPRGEFSLTRFWANRARRILPAATVTIVLSTLGSLWLLPWSVWGDVTRAALASALYVQNLLLAAESVDYLAQEQDPTPFQHFWSLSVEEQFYVLWPVLLLIAGWAAAALRRRHPADAARHERRFRAAAIVIIAAFVAASFAVNVIYVSAGDPQAYFVTWTRLWELGSGGLLAAIHSDWRSTSAARVLLQWAGVVAILVVCFVYTDATPFPGIAALAPVLATVAVIAAGRTHGFGALSRVFEWWPFQRIGDWSYSLYLWHFPVIVFAAAQTGYSESWQLYAGIAALTLGLAVASYYGIERPLLGWEWLKNRHIITIAGALAVVGLTAGIALTPQLLSEQARLREEASTIRPLNAPELKNPPELGPGYGSLREESFDRFFFTDQSIQPSPADARFDEPQFPQCTGTVPATRDSQTTQGCTIAHPGGTKTLALVGDSHAVQWAPALIEAVKGTDWKVVLFGREYCPFTTQPTTMEKDNVQRCVEPAEDVLKQLDALHPDIVIITNRTTTELTSRGSEKIPGTAGFADVFKPLAANGAQVYAMTDTSAPADDSNMATCVAAAALDSPASLEKCDFQPGGASGADSNAALRAAAAEVPGTTVLEPTGLTCTGTTCPAVLGSVAVYRDSNHITVTYSKTAGPWFAERLGLGQ